MPRAPSVQKAPEAGWFIIATCKVHALCTHGINLGVEKRNQSAPEGSAANSSDWGREGEEGGALF